MSWVKETINWARYSHNLHLFVRIKDLSYVCLIENLKKI